METDEVTELTRQGCEGSDEVIDTQNSLCKREVYYDPST